MPEPSKVTKTEIVVTCIALALFGTGVWLLTTHTRADAKILGLCLVLVAPCLIGGFGGDHL